MVEAGAPGLLTYEPYFGLREKAFSLSADPRFFYKTGSHAIAFEALLAGIRRREGLVVLTGDIGTGKTTLCRAALEQLDRKTFVTFVPDPFVSREDLLKMLLIDFGVMSVDDLKRGRLNGASHPDLSYPLYEFLNSLVPLQAFAVLIIDEAQSLSLPLLEEIRILSDLEGREKLIQVVLVGQLEFRTKLKLPQMRPVDQRVSVRCVLEPLSPEGVAGYILHRLEVAGGGRDRIEFSSGAFELVWRGSGGVPRLINQICDRALYRGCIQRTTTIGPEIVRGAIADLGLDAVPAANLRPDAAPARPAPPEIPLSDADPARRGLAGKPGTRAEPTQAGMDLSGLIDVPPVMRSPLGQSSAPANDQKPVRSTAPTFDRVHASSTGALGLGKPAAPPAVAQPEPHAGQADRAPFDRVHAPSTGTLRLEKSAALPAVPQPEPHTGQADQAPFDRDLAPSRGTLGLGRAQDGYDELRGSVRRETRKRGVVLLTAAIAIAAAIAVGAGLWQFRGMLQDLVGSATVVHVPPPAAPAPMVAPGAQRPLEAAPSAAEVPAQPAASAAAERPVQPAAPAASINASVSDASTPFIIQVALFASVQRANRLIDELTQAGFRAYHGELVLGTAHLQQVLVGPYATRAEAELDRDRIRLIPGYQDARVAPAPPAKPSQ